MLLQEFDCEIKDRKDCEDPIAKHLSRVVTSDASEFPIYNRFSDEKLFRAMFHPI